MMQNFLLIGAFVILGILILSINSTIFVTNKAITENEVHITGIGLGQALIEEITSRSFDENTTGSKRVASPSQLTGVDNLSKETGEPPFDDVDDYNNFSKKVDTPRIEGYVINVKVGYANPLTQRNFISTKTYLKRIEVTVKNPKYMHNPDSLILATVVSYFK
ncbi:MAG: hypothetical protein GXO74_07280 [Calditrichaeota bacterium]|nr:hypothetical protein [Calditrichota bacterium]